MGKQTPAKKVWQRLKKQADAELPIAKFCARIRTQFGLSQVKFGEKLNYSHPHIARIELGFYRQPTEYLRALWPYLREEEKEECIAILTEGLIAEIEAA